MGTLSSVLTPIMSIGTVLGGIQKVSHGGSDGDLKQEQYAQNAAFQKQQNLIDFQNAETERRAKLRQLVSKQRAAFGGSGVRSGAGSSEAVLQGMFETSDIERQQNEAETNLANQKIDMGVDQQRRLNLLQKEQLKQKTLLSTLFG